VTEAERWARELLAELRDARFTPRAWRRFFRRSFARATERRRERGREHRQALALGALGLAAWAAIGLTGEPALAAVGFLWWIAIVVMLDWHLGMLERPDGRPLGTIGAPNVLSLVRLGAVPALPALGPEALAGVLVALGATNVLDGLLARRSDRVSRLGAWLDGVADTLVLSTTAVVCASDGRLAAWATALVLLRFSLPALGLVVSYFWLLEPLPANPVRGRAAGVILWLGLVLATLGESPATLLVAAGALGGIAASAASARRANRARLAATRI
jgi:cardiolipin synthase (CMP-forming)